MKSDTQTIRLLFVLSCMVTLVFSPAPVLAQLDLSPPAQITAAPGTMITVPLNLTNPAARAIDAFGLRVTFPSALLEYDTVATAGTLTNGWLVVNGQQISANEINVGGFNITPTSGSGVLLNMVFKVKDTATGKDTLRLGNFTDDLVGATTTPGVVEAPSGPGKVFFAVLSGLQEVPPDTNKASGGGMFVLNSAQTELTFRLRVGGLSGPITAAHFHNAAVGANGPPVRSILNDFTGGVASGVWKSTDSEPLTPALVAELLAGNIYVNVHTADNPGGEIRGQLQTGVTINFAARLEGSQEVPPVATAAGGYGTFILNPTGDSLAYTIGVTGLSGPIIGAHFHNAVADSNGPVKRTLTDEFVGSFATGVWTSTDLEPLTPELVVELLARRLYINVHTAAHPAGEIRGQVVAGAEAVVPIGLARQFPDGTASVTIEGIITTADFRLSSTTSAEYYLQDGTGGIRLFVLSGKAVAARGTRVLVKDGTIGTNSQRRNIEAHRDSIKIIDTPGLPPPQVVTVDFYLNNRAAIEGEHIRINNANLVGNFPATNSDATVSINDGTGTLAMFLDRDTDIDGSTQPPNPVDIIGVATSFNNTPQIQPSARADFLSAVTFLATLSGDQEVPAVTTTAQGGGMFVLNPDATELTFNIRVHGLSGPITAAHFHNAAAGANGSPVRTLTADFVGEVAAGVWKNTDSEPLTPALVAELLAGNIYVNVHTATNPAGEIRGQLLVGVEKKLVAALSGAQEVPPVTLPGSGVGSFALNAVGTELAFNVTVTGLSGPVAGAHFHNAPAGVNGPAVRTITGDFIGNTASGVWKAGDSEALTPALVAELLAGAIYVNIHTAANPAGEIRGQLGSGAENVFHAVLNGAQEVPALEVPGSGGGRFVLSADKSQLAFHVKVAGLSGPIAGAHFHNAAAGVNGPVVRTITSSFTDTVATGVWQSTDSEPLTPALVAELLAGNIYVNIHTAAHAGGEIRGQLFTGTPLTLAAQLEGSQEVPPVNAAAAGYGKFTLNSDGTELSYDVGVIGLSGAIAGAHFHNAAAGRNGPVVRTITGDFSGGFAKGIWKSSDAEPLTPAMVVELLAGQIYVNVHTAAHPGGEIRGQVWPGAQAVVPIGLARLLPDGTAPVTIAGVITTVDFRLSSTTSGEYYLQDATGGLRMFVFGGKATVARGERVIVKDGLIGTNSGRKNIEAHADSIDVVGAPGLPEARVVTAAEYTANRATLEGLHIRIDGANISGSYPPAGSNATLAINDGTGDLNMFIDLDTDIDGSPQPNNPVSITGVATSFNDVLQIQPSEAADIVSTSGVATSAGEIPREFRLAQNYPNPFNPTTIIRYDLPRDVHVRLVIFNLLGERIRTLVETDVRAGYRQVTWDGTNDAGNKVASGVYLYRMEAGADVATRKLMLMK